MTKYISLLFIFFVLTGFTGCAELPQAEIVEPIKPTEEKMVEVEEVASEKKIESQPTKKITTIAPTKQIVVEEKPPVPLQGYEVRSLG